MYLLTAVLFTFTLTVRCQIEQSILGQLFYPPISSYDHVNKQSEVTSINNETKRKVEKQLTEEEDKIKILKDYMQESTQENPELRLTAQGYRSDDNRLLKVLPILSRFRRSGFGRKESSQGNNVDLERVKEKLNDPSWLPEILLRKNWD